MHKELQDLKVKAEHLEDPVLLASQGFVVPKDPMVNQDLKAQLENLEHQDRMVNQVVKVHRVKWVSQDCRVLLVSQGLQVR